MVVWNRPGARHVCLVVLIIGLSSAEVAYPANLNTGGTDYHPQSPRLVKALETRGESRVDCCSLETSLFSEMEIIKGVLVKLGMSKSTVIQRLELHYTARVMPPSTRMFCPVI